MIISGAYDNMAPNGQKDNDSINRPASLHLEINLTLEIGQVLLSLLHAWGLDKDLDRVAVTKLGKLNCYSNTYFLSSKKLG